MNARKPVTALFALFLLCIAITLVGTSCQGQKPDVPQGRFTVMSTQYLKRDDYNGYNVMVLHDNETEVEYLALDKINSVSVTKLEK